MKLGETRKVVTFNLDRPEHREMLKFAESVNFSSWVRNCIKSELKKRARTELSSIRYETEG